MSKALSVRTPAEVSPALKRMKRSDLCVALLHSGGPAPGGNRVIAAAAKQLLDRGVPVIGIMNGYEFLSRFAPEEGLKPNEHYMHIDQELASRAIDQNALIIRTSRANPGNLVRKPEDLEDPEKTKQLERILDAFEYLRVGALISIGGDDTLKTANFLHQIALRRMRGNPNLNFQGVVHVPKTIDNDYYGIPWTYGFFTAAEAAGREIRGFYDDAKATNCYHVVELMGRKAGWYTAAASIFGRATRALIPEDYKRDRIIDFDAIADELIELILRRETEGKGYGVICAAEGLADKLPPGERKQVKRDRHGNPKYSDAKIGEKLAERLEDKYRERTGKSKSFKSQTVGYETRQNPPNLYDALLTSQLGIGAFRLIEDGRLGEMVSVKDNLSIKGVPFRNSIDPRTLRVRNRNIDPGGDFYWLLRSLEEYTG